MSKWLKAWELLRDVGMTAFGGWIIYRQVYAANASVPLILLGGALMVPAARANVLALLPILLGTAESSSSSPPAGELPSAPSSPREEGTGER